MRLRKMFRFTVCCIVCVCVLCGCKSGRGGRTSLSLAETYTCTVTVVTGAFHWKGELTKEGAGLYRVEVLAPDTMHGVTVQSDGNTVSLAFDNARQELPQEVLAESDVTRLFRTMHTIVQPGQLQRCGQDAEGERFDYVGALGSFTVKTDERGWGREVVYTDRDFSIFLENYRPGE